MVVFWLTEEARDQEVRRSRVQIPIFPWQQLFQRNHRQLERTSGAVLKAKVMMSWCFVGEVLKMPITQINKLLNIKSFKNYYP